ncbi:SRPBCC family protein [Rhodococcus oxybenzonivorans]|uniref:SRPBCC family protein n=1 Tax=Rhodococcus TaxID=1827 RepID=UPI0037CAD50D
MPPETIWNLTADVRNLGRFSPEVIEAEWLDGAVGPVSWARFRGHITSRPTAREPMSPNRSTSRWGLSSSPHRCTSYASGATAATC